MTIKSIDDLPAAGSVSGTDLVLIRQGGVSKKATASQVAAIGTAGVTSVNTRSGAVTLSESDVGLSGHKGGGGSEHANAVASGAAGFMTGADKAKLDGVSVGATNYTHPANHPASIITQDSSNRFVTDAEKTAWNAKQAAGSYEVTASKDTSGGYAGLTLFKLNLRNAANTITSWFTTAATVARTWTLPDKDGTIAMTSDITGVNSGTNTGDETLATIKSKLGITTLSGSNTGDQTTVSGNAGTATALQTPRNINGVAFDGTANITINAVDATARVASSLLGAVSGVATLDAGGKVPTAQLPAYVDDVLEYANLAAFPGTGTAGIIYVALDTNKTYRWSGSAYVYITSGAVDSVAGKTGVVALVKGDVGLGSVDNTADSAKPVSTAQATADTAIGTAAASDATTKANAAQAAAIAASAPVAHVGAGGTAHAAVVAAGASGFMTGADKTKLDGIATNANNYSLPVATGAVLGGVKVGSGLTVDGAGLIATTGAVATPILISTNTTATSGNNYVMTAALTLTLPATPTAGDSVMFENISGASCTVARNGKPIMGLAEDLVLDINNVTAKLVYKDVTAGWIATSITGATTVNTTAWTSLTGVPSLAPTASPTFTGDTKARDGIRLGDAVYPTYEINLDFGADVAGTWRKIVTVSLANSTYSTHGFVIDVIDPLVNYATVGSASTTVSSKYFVACARSEGLTIDTPDLCVVRGPSSHIRAVKTSTGNYEIQAKNTQQWHELRISITTYATNDPGHTITYHNGSSIGSTGTAQYAASVGSNIDWFSNVKATKYESTVATGTAPLTVASTTAVTNLNADLLDGAHKDTAYNSFGNGTIPVRHSAGYIYSNYFNCSANEETVAPNRVAIERYGDGFIRWQTWAQFKLNIFSSPTFTTNATSPIFTSTVATGTAPLTVTSTTKVTNLNADLLDGIDSTAIVYGNGGSGSQTAPTPTWNGTHISQYKSGFWDVFGASWTPTTDWWWGITTAHTSNSSAYLYGGQMIFSNTTTDVYVRTVAGGAVPNASAWQQVLTSTRGTYSGTLTSGQITTALGYTPSSPAGLSSSVIGTNTTATAGGVYVFTASLTLTLPASPSAGNLVRFCNMSGGTSCVIARNGKNIMGIAQDLTVDVNYTHGELMYADATRGWVLI